MHIIEGTKPPVVERTNPRTVAPETPYGRLSVRWSGDSFWIGTIGSIVKQELMDVSDTAFSQWAGVSELIVVNGISYRFECPFQLDLSAYERFGETWQTTPYNLDMERIDPPDGMTYSRRRGSPTARRTVCKELAEYMDWWTTTETATELMTEANRINTRNRIARLRWERSELLGALTERETELVDLLGADVADLIEMHRTLTPDL